MSSLILNLLLDRILELGFGKEIEEILDILGSRNDGFVGKEKEVPNSKRQNLLLSATLNEKVNNLARISLEDPVMIGLDDKKVQQDALCEQSGSLGSAMNEELEHPSAMMSSSSGDYNLPAQLVQKFVKGIYCFLGGPLTLG